MRQSGTAQIEIKEDSRMAEQMTVLRQIHVIGRRNPQLRHMKPWKLTMNRNQLFRIRIRQRTKRNCIQRGERSGRAAQPGSKHHNGDR